MTRTPGGVGGAAPQGDPPIPIRSAFTLHEVGLLFVLINLTWLLTSFDSEAFLLPFLGMLSLAGRDQG